ncbi:MAG: hypothetical protein ACJ8AH_25660 [Stellaceae bacterium]
MGRVSQLEHRIEDDLGGRLAAEPDGLVSLLRYDRELFDYIPACMIAQNFRPRDEVQNQCIQVRANQ